jgi:hypothetical protein
MGEPQQLAALLVSDVGYGARIKQVDVGSRAGGDNLIASLKELAS